jgi:hypothetical protein
MKFMIDSLDHLDDLDTEFDSFAKAYFKVIPDLMRDAKRLPNGKILWQKQGLEGSPYTMAELEAHCIQHGKVRLVAQGVHPDGRKVSAAGSVCIMEAESAKKENQKTTESLQQVLGRLSAGTGQTIVATNMAGQTITAKGNVK